MIDKILKLKQLKVKYLHTPYIRNGLEYEQQNDKLEFMKYRNNEITREVLESKCELYQKALFHLLVYYQSHPRLQGGCFYCLH